MLRRAQSPIILKEHWGNWCGNAPKEFKPQSQMQNLVPNGRILGSFADFYVRKTWKAVMLAPGRDNKGAGSHQQPAPSAQPLGGELRPGSGYRQSGDNQLLAFLRNCPCWPPGGKQSGGQLGRRRWPTWSKGGGTMPGVAQPSLPQLGPCSRQERVLPPSRAEQNSNSPRASGSIREIAGGSGPG